MIHSTGDDQHHCQHHLLPGMKGSGGGGGVMEGRLWGRWWRGDSGKVRSEGMVIRDRITIATGMDVKDWGGAYPDSDVILG